MYSGTVSDATAGFLIGIPSMVVSLSTYNQNFDCTYSAELASKILLEFLNIPESKKTLLNVNIPAISKEQIKGIQITQCCNTYWSDKYEKRIDSFGRPYYWFALEEYISND